MPVKALNPLLPFWYTPKACTGEEKPTRFKIRGLNGAELGHVLPELEVDERERMVSQITGRGIEQILGFGLVDWENFENADGQLGFSPRNFPLINHPLRVELAWQILGASYADQAQKKT